MNLVASMAQMYKSRRLRLNLGRGNRTNRLSWPISRVAPGTLVLSSDSWIKATSDTLFDFGHGPSSEPI